jgi:hypothetical protein
LQNGLEGFVELAHGGAPEVFIDTTIDTGGIRHARGRGASIRRRCSAYSWSALGVGRAQMPTASIAAARAILELKGKNKVGFQEYAADNARGPRLRAQPRASQEPGYGFAARYCARFAVWAATRSLAPATPRFTSRSARFKRSRST